jgi:hypothetical protein
LSELIQRKRDELEEAAIRYAKSRGCLSELKRISAELLRLYEDKEAETRDKLRRRGDLVH